MLIPCTSKSGTSFGAALASSAAVATPRARSANTQRHAIRRLLIRPPWKSVVTLRLAEEFGQEKGGVTVQSLEALGFWAFRRPEVGTLALDRYCHAVPDR